VIGHDSVHRGSYIDLAGPDVAIWIEQPNGRRLAFRGAAVATAHVLAILATVHGSMKYHSKQLVLAQLSTTDIGPPGRDSLYGRGLAAAPEACLGPE
jgi:hypothetical protein